jgi:hypothetical protein
MRYVSPLRVRSTTHSPRPEVGNESRFAVFTVTLELGEKDQNRSPSVIRVEVVPVSRIVERNEPAMQATSSELGNDVGWVGEDVISSMTAQDR